MKNIGENIIFTPKTLALYTAALLGLGGGAFTMAREIAVTPANGHQVDKVEDRLASIEKVMKFMYAEMCEIRNDRRVDRGEPSRQCGELPL